MLNQRSSNIFEYYNRAKYYQLVALLYDKISGNGIIAEKDFYCPIFENSEKYDDLLQNKAERKYYVQPIDNIIAENKLNRNFCKKLSESASLRYLLAIGFHDVPINKLLVENNMLKMFIDCSAANHKPDFDKDIVELCFENYTVNQNNLQDEKQNEYYYDRQEIYYLDNSELMVVLGLNNRGELLKNIELQIAASDIFIC